MTVDVSGAFSDPDEDALSYEARACLHSGVSTRAQLASYLRVDRWQALQCGRGHAGAAAGLPDPRMILYKLLLVIDLRLIIPL